MDLKGNRSRLFGYHNFIPFFVTVPRCKCRNLVLSNYENEMNILVFHCLVKRVSIIRTSIFTTTQMFRNTKVF